MEQKKGQAGKQKQVYYVRKDQVQTSNELYSHEDQLMHRNEDRFNNQYNSQTQSNVNNNVQQFQTQQKYQKNQNFSSNDIVNYNNVNIQQSNMNQQPQQQQKQQNQNSQYQRKSDNNNNNNQYPQQQQYQTSQQNPQQKQQQQQNNNQQFQQQPQKQQIKYQLKQEQQPQQQYQQQNQMQQQQIYYQKQSNQQNTNEKQKNQSNEQYEKSNQNQNKRPIFIEKGQENNQQLQIPNNKENENGNKGKQQKQESEQEKKEFAEFQQFLKDQVESNNRISDWVCKICDFSKNQWVNKYCFKCACAVGSELSGLTQGGNSDFDYLFFVDYECNQAKGVSEIIEFPVQVIDVNARKIIDNPFQSFVKPSYKVSRIITQLTGIDDESVRQAPILKNVINQVMDYISQFKGRTAVVYDCDSDAKFLRDECTYKKLTIPQVFKSFINLKEVFPAKIAKRLPKSMKEMLEIFKMEFNGTQHYGVDDAYNQARIGLELINLGYVFKKENLEPIQGARKKQNNNDSNKLECQQVIHFEFDRIKPFSIENKGSFYGISCGVTQIEGIGKKTEPVTLLGHESEQIWTNQRPIEQIQTNTNSFNEFIVQSVQGLAKFLKSKGSQNVKCVSIPSSQYYKACFLEMFLALRSKGDKSAMNDFSFILQCLGHFVPFDVLIMTEIRKMKKHEEKCKEIVENLKSLSSIDSFDTVSLEVEIIDKLVKLTKNDLSSNKIKSLLLKQ